VTRGGTVVVVVAVVDVEEIVVEVTGERGQV